jgi:hypothetical protein
MPLTTPASPNVSFGLFQEEPVSESPAANVESISENS